MILTLILTNMILTLILNIILTLFYPYPYSFFTPYPDPNSYHNIYPNPDPKPNPNSVELANLFEFRLENGKIVLRFKEPLQRSCPHNPGSMSSALSLSYKYFSTHPLWD